MAWRRRWRGSMLAPAPFFRRDFGLLDGASHAPATGARGGESRRGCQRLLEFLRGRTSLASPLPQEETGDFPGRREILPGFAELAAEEEKDRPFRRAPLYLERCGVNRLGNLGPPAVAQMDGR